MKVAKVNHKRTAVAINKKKEDSLVSGILYQNPGENGKTGTLVGYIEKLNNRAKGIYNVLTLPESFTDNKKEMELAKAITEYCNQLFKGFLDEYSSPKKKSLLGVWNSLIYGKSGKPNTKPDIEFDDIEKDVFIAALMETCLRKTLRRNVHFKVGENEYIDVDLRKVFRQIIDAVCAGDNAVQEYKRIRGNELKALLFAVNQDYMKRDRIRKIAKSIEKQNVKVQTDPKNGYLLTLSTAVNEKKKYVFDYIRRYANADEVGRNALLRTFRELELLFYCGEDAYWGFKGTRMPVWSSKAFLIGKTDLFSEFANDLIARKKKADKKQSKILSAEIKNELRNEIKKRYRKAIDILELRDDNNKEIVCEERYWLQFIEKSAEKMLVKRSNVESYMLNIQYLFNHTWREFLSYICMKYIDMGKAVYHFATPDLSICSRSTPIKIKEILPQYREGLTSFDYERIKAEETIERDLAVYVTFAINNFYRSVCADDFRMAKDNEDILYIDESKLIIRDNAKNHVLRYFGGQSKWQDTPIETWEDKDFVLGIRAELEKVRNISFHYTATATMGTVQAKPIIPQLFDKEYAELGSVYRKKYVSNNVLRFYPVADIDNLMDYLYAAPVERPAQIPSFNKIIRRANIQSFLDDLEIRPESMKKVTNAGKAEEFRSSLYFVLKEIYYYGFLQQEDLVERFRVAMEREKDCIDRKRITGKEKKVQKLAMKNFDDRMRQIEYANQNMSFGTLCQQLMTDYNQQNRGNQKIKPNNENKQDEKKYEYYRMLLYVCIRHAFLDYVRNYEVQGVQLFDFLRGPKVKENKDEYIYEGLTQEQFCQGWQAHTFDDLQNNEKKGLAMSWYTAAHFLLPKQLNHLIGSIKNYIQFAEDISRRSHANGNKQERMADTAVRIKLYRAVLRTLEFTMLQVGQLSGNVEDYFINGNNEYAECIKNYVDIGNGYESAYQLQEFCRIPVEDSPSGKIGIYYDEKNPIPNRNLVKAMMYSCDTLFSNFMETDKITEDEIRSYYRQAKELEEVFKRGKCETAEEQKKLRTFQQTKNRIELLDIVTYSEMINDLLSQLVSWSYLRERDLMYFQLGFHYMRLYYGDEQQMRAIDDKYRTLVGKETAKGEKKTADINLEEGALLYQIIAMYTYGLPIYTVEEDGRVSVAIKQGHTGLCIKKFAEEYCKGDESIFDAGLELFQYTNESDDVDNGIFALRNYIDHFKYYAKMDRSLLDLYGDVYDRFFTYDRKLQKNVIFVLQNILMRYFVISNIGIGKRDHNYRCKGTGLIRKASTIELREKVRKGKDGEISKYFLSSDTFTYKFWNSIKGKEDVEEIPVRDSRFLADVKKILEFSCK